MSNPAKARPENCIDGRNISNNKINNNRFTLMRNNDPRSCGLIFSWKKRDGHGRSHKVFFSHAGAWRTPDNYSRADCYIGSHCLPLTGGHLPNQHLITYIADPLS